MNPDPIQPETRRRMYVVGRPYNSLSWFPLPNSYRSPEPMSKATKPITLGDNLQIRRRHGVTTVVFGVRQTFATQQVIHLMQAVSEQSLDAKTLAAAKDAIAALTDVLDRTVKTAEAPPTL